MALAEAEAGVAVVVEAVTMGVGEVDLQARCLPLFPPHLTQTIR